MKNYALTKDLKEGVFKNLFLKISIGSVGGYSIEVEDEELNSFASYTYKVEEERDLDFNTLLITLWKKVTRA